MSIFATFLEVEDTTLAQHLENGQLQEDPYHLLDVWVLNNLSHLPIDS